MKRRIVIGADIVPTDSNKDFFCKGEMKPVVGEELIQFFLDETFLICNLETPLAECSSPIVKCGPNFISPIDSANGLKKLGVDLVSLANNHIKDQGNQGIISTCHALNTCNLPYVGIGENESTASIPYIFEFNGKMVGVYACAEHEFSSADNDEYGANTFDAFVTPDHIKQLKHSCDYVIVLYHGGKEYYRYPSPNLQKVCRHIADKGADLIICQHSHCIGVEEIYNSSTIIYGQGNFIFNKKDNEYWNSSILVCVNEGFKISYVPIVRTSSGTRMANNLEKELILREFRNRSELAKSSDFIEREYNKHSQTLLNSYLITFNGKKNRLWSAINKVSKGILFDIVRKKRYPKKQLAAIKNYIECEAHREMIIDAINAALKAD